MDIPEETSKAEELSSIENAEEKEELSPEEILERAKTENKRFGDERQRGRMERGNYVGFIAVEFTVAIILIVSTIVSDRLPIEFFIILFTGVAAQDIAQACVCAKKMRIFYGVMGGLIAACALLYWVFWILELCGITVLG